MKRTKENWRCEVPSEFGKWICACAAAAGGIVGWFGVTVAGMCLAVWCEAAFGTPMTFIEPTETAACDPERGTKWGKAYNGYVRAIECSVWNIDETKCRDEEGERWDRVARAIHEALETEGRKGAAVLYERPRREASYPWMSTKYKEAVRRVARAAGRAIERANKQAGQRWEACVFCAGKLERGLCVACGQTQPDTMAAARMKDPTALGRWAALGIIERVMDENRDADEPLDGAALTDELETIARLCGGDRDAWEARGWVKPPVTWGWLVADGAIGDGHDEPEILAVRDFAQLRDELEEATGDEFVTCDGCGLFRACVRTDEGDAGAMAICGECRERAMQEMSAWEKAYRENLRSQTLQTQRARRWARTWKRAAKDARFELARKGELVVSQDYELFLMRSKPTAREQESDKRFEERLLRLNQELAAQSATAERWAKRWKGLARRYRDGIEEMRSRLAKRPDAFGREAARGAAGVWLELTGPQTIPAKPGDTWETFPCGECKMPALQCAGDCCTVCDHDIGDAFDDGSGPDGWVGPGDTQLVFTPDNRIGEVPKVCGAAHASGLVCDCPNTGDGPVRCLLDDGAPLHHATTNSIIFGWDVSTGPLYIHAGADEWRRRNHTGDWEMNEFGVQNDEKTVSQAHERPASSDDEKHAGDKPTCGTRHDSGLVCTAEPHYGELSSHRARLPDGREVSWWSGGGNAADLRVRAEEEGAYIPVTFRDWTPGQFAQTSSDGGKGAADKPTCGAKHGSGLVCDYDKAHGGECAAWCEKSMPRFGERLGWSSPSGPLHVVGTGEGRDWTPGQYASTVQPSDIAVQEPMFRVEAAQKKTPVPEVPETGVLGHFYSGSRYLNETVVSSAKGGTFHTSDEIAQRSKETDIKQKHEWPEGGNEPATQRPLSRWGRLLVQWVVQWCTRTGHAAAVENGVGKLQPGDAWERVTVESLERAHAAYARGTRVATAARLLHEGLALALKQALTVETNPWGEEWHDAIAWRLAVGVSGEAQTKEEVQRLFRECVALWDELVVREVKS